MKVPMTAWKIKRKAHAGNFNIAIFRQQEVFK